ncbi:hypothetical protein OG429_05910 [Streptomyces sp. NBC_00190]|uniref:hypothetical protein n=1 Tax=unclassified Streptomyces TaxID=2593676 RepID=UPI002E2AD60E|nr:hypothetical protein [Streptomyces sp. NBC_00190]WSZ38904.1 hypothetical protein OG239_08920 [Streptomyces sp. NBC_00868]
MSVHAGTRPSGGRVRAAWRAAHTPVAGVPRWARIAAYAIPFTVLPSGIWRLGLLFVDHSAADSGRLPHWLPLDVYVVVLSVLSELLAFTAVGLVAAWGEVVPRWIPVLGGRRIPVAAACVPAALGAFALTVLWTVLAAVTQVAGTTVQGDPLPDDFPSEAGGWSAVWFYVCYTPLVLWGPLLGAVTVAYWRRRAGGGAGALDIT